MPRYLWPVILLAIILGFSGCKSPWPSFSTYSSDTKAAKAKGAEEARNVVGDDENWAAKARPRKGGTEPYFFNEQARQIERNLGI